MAVGQLLVRSGSRHGSLSAPQRRARSSSLSLPFRQALLRRDVQGLSYEEIAEFQEVPVGTVRSRIAAVVPR